MNKWISKEDACKVAEPYGAFQYADAQGDVRHQFANDIIGRHERIRNAAPDLLATLVETQTLLAAMLHEARPCKEIQQQMVSNRSAITLAKRGAA